MYQRSSSVESMSALSPVTTAAPIGARVSGLRRAWWKPSTIAATVATVSCSCGRKAPIQVDSSCTIIGSMRHGDWASMRCRSERCAR